MQQLTLAQAAEFQRYGKKTRREHFLDEMEAVMPWTAGCTALFEGRDGPQAGGSCDHAAGLLRAAVVCVVGSWR